MKRTIIKLCVLLLLGAIVNVAVAWGSATLVSREQYDQAFRSKLDRASLRETQPVVEEARLNREADYNGLSTSWPLLAFRGTFRDVVVTQHSEVRDVAFSVRSYMHHCGFPSRTLSGCQLVIRNYGRLHPGLDYPTRISPVVSVESVTAISLKQKLDLCQGRDWFRFDSTTKLLPYGIIWPGFAINTVFYAAILWVVFFVPGVVRRRIRRRRGRCPACAYPIGSSEVCTECGKAVPE